MSVVAWREGEAMHVSGSMDRREAVHVSGSMDRREGNACQQ